MSISNDNIPKYNTNKIKTNLAMFGNFAKKNCTNNYSIIKIVDYLIIVD